MSVVTPAAARFGRLRAARNPQLWLERTRWTIERPGRVVAVLALIGLVIRQAWISVQPLASGDWSWRDSGRLSSYFPWPSLWDPSLGLGGANRFLAAFRFPVYAVTGVLSRIGASWTAIEQVLYFLPFAILLPVAGWLLAREIMGNSRWTLLTPLLLLGNTYFLVEANGEIPLTLSEAIGILALFGFLRAMRQRSVGWALVTGLLVGLASAVDIRPAYLSLALLAMYFVVLALSSLDWGLLWRRALIGLVTLGVFVGTQAFWLVPLLTYHGNAGLPIPPTPDFPILRIGHGLAGVIAFWTGGLPAVNAQAPLNPVFMILPILAFVPLLRRRLTPEVMWLGLAALAFAFFVNTDNPPFGSIYDWMYAHVPGWNLFREGSKFLFVVGVAYAILIPIALRAAFEWVASRRPGRRRTLVRGGAAVGLVAVVALSAWSIGVLESGNLDSTTSPTSEPASFSDLSTLLSRDSRTGSVLWFGQPVTTEGLRHHTFIVASPTHPEVNLTGRFNPASDVSHRDPYQLYCTDNSVPFCYVDRQLFPYLTRMSGAGYIVLPAAQSIGVLPHGITRAWLQQQVTGMFGRPRVLGDKGGQLLVWRLPSPNAAVTTAPAVASVNGGTWATPSVLPALVAMDVPAAYRQSFDNSHYPASPAGLPDTVGVLPRADGACVGPAAASVGIMAQTTAPSLAVTVAQANTTLPLLTAPSRISGWGIYGPVSIGPGSIPMSAPATGTTLGPCIVWSALARTALGPHDNAASGISVGSDGELVSAHSVGGPWVELQRFHDPGWQLGGNSSVSTGDGIFNLYHLAGSGGGPLTLTFTYSTTGWETVGLVLSGIVLLLAILLAVRDFRRRRGMTSEARVTAPPLVLTPSPAGRWLAFIGMGMLVATALAVTAEWFGVPSTLPGASFASDPYSLDVGYGAAAIGILVLSLAVRVVAHLGLARRTQPYVRRVRIPLRAGATAATLMITALILVSCERSPGDLQNLLTQAQKAGALSSTIEGGSLDEARLHRAAHQPLQCIADYTEALGSFPDLVQAYAGRADCYLSGGKNGPGAVHDYSQAISLAPARSALYLRRATADRSSGNLPAALDDYQQAAVVPGATPNQQLSAIDGILAIDEFTTARRVYQEALARDPRSPILQLAAADIALATGDESGADRAFASALQLATNKLDVAQVLGRLCHHEVLGHLYGKAAIDCASAAQLSRSPSGAYDNLAAAQLALGNPTTALVDMNAAIGAWIGDIGEFAQPAGVDGFGLAQLYSARAWVEVQLHDTGAAVADFQQALRALPTAAPDIRARLRASIATAESD